MDVVHGERYVQFFLWNKRLPRVQNHMGLSAQRSVAGKTRKYKLSRQVRYRCHEAVTRKIVASVVGHLPREISRLTHFIIVHGAKVSCKVVDVHHRRSPRVQVFLKVR